MKLLFVIHSLRGGGTGRVCAALATGLGERGHRVTVAVSSLEQSMWHDAFGPSVELVDLGVDHARTAVGPLTRLVRDTRPDVVLAFNYQLAIALLLVRRMAQLGGAPRFRLVSRHIVALSESAKLKSPRQRLIIRTLVTWLYRKVDCVIAQSDGMYRDLVENFRIPPNHAEVIYNPVLPAPGVSENSENELPELFHPNRSEPPVILYLGRFKPQKQPMLLLDLIERLRLRFPEAMLAAGGDGPLLDEFLQEAQRRGLAEGVEYLGYVRDTVPLFKRAAVTVLTSAYEGFPNVLIDSISLGTPVVSFDCPTGPKEIIELGLNGYLVPLNDIEKMARMVERCIAAPPDPIVVRRTAEQFSLERTIDRYERVLCG